MCTLPLFFTETLLRLTEIFLQVRRDVQEILHLFRPHLHSHEVQVEVSTRNCDLDIGDKRTAVFMINITAARKFAWTYRTVLVCVGFRFTISTFQCLCPHIMRQAKYPRQVPHFFAVWMPVLTPECGQDKGGNECLVLV